MHQGTADSTFKGQAIGGTLLFGVRLCLKLFGDSIKFIFQGLLVLLPFFLVSFPVFFPFVSLISVDPNLSFFLPSSFFLDAAES